jgi:segregation and condensation protein B
MQDLEQTQEAAGSADEAPDQAEERHPDTSEQSGADTGSESGAAQLDYQTELEGDGSANTDVGEDAADETGNQGEPEAGDLFVAEVVSEHQPGGAPHPMLKAIIEAAIYITDEPLSTEQIAAAIEQPVSTVKEVLEQLVLEYGQADRGLTVRELAGGYKMGTKPEIHESIRAFVKKLQPPLKLSLAALETLAVVAYKQPITAPEIMEIRGVQGAGVLKTLLDRKLIATAGRKDVIGKPIMYKTTKEFLIQFGLSSLNELPTLKEFEELGRLALTDETQQEPEGPSTPQEARESASAGAGTEAVAEAEPPSTEPDQTPAFLGGEASSEEQHESAAAAIGPQAQDSAMSNDSGEKTSDA